MSVHTNQLRTKTATLGGKTYVLDSAAAAMVEAFFIAHSLAESPGALADDEGTVSAIPFMEKAFAEAEGGRAAACLRTNRWKLQLTQKALAVAAGVQPTHLSAMERGKRAVGKAVAQRFAKVLKCDWRELVSE